MILESKAKVVSLYYVKKSIISAFIFLIQHILEARAEFFHCFLEGLEAIDKSFSDF